MEIVRSWLFVPGSQPRMLDKAPTLAADVLVYDLEDSVAPSERENARQSVADALSRPPGRALRYVRVSSLSAEPLERDLAAVVKPGLDGLILPKVESLDDVLRVDALLTGLETKDHGDSRHVKLVATIESARGLLAAAAIASGRPRLMGLLFGAEDYALDMGIVGLQAGAAGDMIYARSAVAVAAASWGAISVDRVVTDFRNTRSLVQDSRAARQMGFSGKALIHPTQIDPVNKAFSPTPDELKEAQSVIERYTLAVGDGTGAVQVDGAMIDTPIVERARRILEFADDLKRTGS